MFHEINRFTLTDSPRDGAAVDLARVRSTAHRGGDYAFNLYGHGFEATRYLTRDELGDLRDWITRELAEQKAVA